MKCEHAQEFLSEYVTGEMDRALTYLDNSPDRMKGFAWLLVNLDEFIYVR